MELFRTGVRLPSGPFLLVYQLLTRRCAMDAYEEGLRARVWLRVRRRKTGCWEWVGSKGTGRQKAPQYGRVKVKGRLVSVHRLVWEWFNGPVPKGLCVLHKCDNPNCVNPRHLFVGTHQDNTVDALDKGRMVPPPMPASTRLRADGMVRCCRCLRFLPPSEYRKSKSNKSHGCQSTCKDCHNTLSSVRSKNKRK